MAPLLGSPTAKLAHECVCVCVHLLQNTPRKRTPREHTKAMAAVFPWVWRTGQLGVGGTPCRPSLSTRHQPPSDEDAEVDGGDSAFLGSPACPPTALRVSSSGWQGREPTPGCATPCLGQEREAVRSMIALKNRRLYAAPPCKGPAHQVPPLLRHQRQTTRLSRALRVQH